MALKRSIEKSEYDALDAGKKAVYVEREGKYLLDVDDSQAITALESERQTRKALEAKLAGYGDLSPEQVKALNEAKAKAERDKDFASGNFEKILAEERARHAKDLELRDAGEKVLRQSLESALIGEESVRALAAEGGSPDLLLPIIKGRAKLETVGDRLMAVVIGDKGGPLLKAGAQKADDYMPISEFVSTVLKPDKRYAGAFPGPSGSGTGGQRTVGMTTRQAPSSADQKAKADRVQQALRDGATVITE